MADSAVRDAHPHELLLSRVWGCWVHVHVYIVQKHKQSQPRSVAELDWPETHSGEHIYIYDHICIYSIFRYIYTYIYAYILVCIYAYMWCVYICIYVVCVCVCIYTQMALMASSARRQGLPFGPKESDRLEESWLEEQDVE